MGLLDDLSGAVKRQWSQGEPYRVALGGLLSGDTQPAMGLLSQKVKADPLTVDQATQLAMDWGPMALGTLKAFHGTNAKFDDFDLSKAGQTDEGFAGQGAYFTNSRDIAAEYGNNVIERKLDLRNPLIVDDYDQINKMLNLSTERDRTGDLSRQIREKLMKRGYDSVIVRDFDEMRNPVNEYVVFDPSRIKK